jgi:hypothetical protein
MALNNTLYQIESMSFAILYYLFDFTDVNFFNKRSCNWSIGRS